MSVEAKKWVEQNPARTSAQQAVLEALAWASQGRGLGARVSYRAIASKTLLHRNTVLRALKDLEVDDRIRRHRDHGEDCGRCAGARRGVAVYDVVIPAVSERAPSGQMNLLAGAPVTGTPEVPVEVPVTAPVQPSHGATTGTPEVPQGSTGTFKDSSSGPAREAPNELRDTVERVIAALAPTRLFVDRYAIEGVVMRNADRDVDGAVTAVIALAADPAYRLPKGGAAMMLLRELRGQARSGGAVPVFPPRRRNGNPGAADFQALKGAAA